MIGRRLLTAFFILVFAGSCWAGPTTTQDTAKKFCSSWTAWRNSQPINKPTLHVKGTCLFPTSGYSVMLQPAVPQGFNPNIYLLNLVIRIPLDKGTPPPVSIDVNYSEQTDKVYSDVQITPDDVTVPVKEISAASLNSTGGGDEETITGCIYSIQDCTVLVTRDGQYYHLSGPDDEVSKAKAAKTVIRVTGKPGTWDEASASCKSEHVKPITIVALTVTRMRCASTAPAADNAVKDMKSPCSGWKAWHDSQPGTKPTLYVAGTCTFPTGGYSVELKPAAPPHGIFLKNRVLDLIIHKPTGNVTQQITDVPVKYSEEATRVYPQVEIKPDGIYVPVREVSASTLTPVATSSLQPSAASQRIRNFSSTTDRNGSQHPVTADIHSNGVITCTSAAGNNPRQYPPSCFVLGQVLPQGQTAGTGGGGSMTLTCNGQAPLRCTVQIAD